MEPNATQRIEAETLKHQYQQALRLLESRRCPVREFLSEIQKATGMPVKLVAMYSFKGQANGQSPEFLEYDGRLQSALYKCRDTTEYSNWQYRYLEFRKDNPEFRMFVLIAPDTAGIELAQPASKDGKANKKFEFTTNDCRFLRSLYIAADEPN